MATRTYSFTRPNADPFVPVGWTSRGQIAGKVQSNFYVGNSVDGSQNSIITDDFDIPVLTYSASVVFGAVGSTSAGVALVNASNNGYMFIARSTDIRVFLVVAGALSGGALATYAGATSNGELIINVVEGVGGGNSSFQTTFATTAGGTPTVLGTVTNATYKDLFAGCVCRGAGQIASAKLEYTPTHTFDTFNSSNDIQVGQQDVLYTTTGFASVTAINSDKAGLTTSGIADVAGDGNIDVSGWVEAGLYPSLPSSVIFTATDGTNTAQITKNVIAPSTYSQVTLLNAITDDPTYFAYWLVQLGRSAANGAIIYWPTTAGFSFNADGGVTSNAQRVISPWVWDVLNGRMYEYTVTVNDAGQVVGVNKEMFHIGIGIGIGI